MPGNCCAIYGCTNNTIINCSKSFFRFPKNENTCKQWLEKCKNKELDKIFQERGGQVLNKNYRVCADHFLDNDFRNAKMHSQGLIRDAVPKTEPLVLQQNLKMLYDLQSKNIGKSSAKPPLLESSEELRSPIERINQIKSNTSNTEKNNVERLTVSVSPKNVLLCKNEAEQYTTSPEGIKRKREPGIEESTLKKKLRLSQKCASKYKALVSTLRNKLISLKEDNKRLRTQLQHSSKPQRTLMSSLDTSDKPKGRRYTDSEKNLALALYYCSPKAYRFLQIHSSLPTVRSLRSWLQYSLVDPGLNEMLKLMEVKADFTIPRKS